MTHEEMVAVLDRLVEFATAHDEDDDYILLGIQPPFGAYHQITLGDLRALEEVKFVIPDDMIEVARYG